MEYIHSRFSLFCHSYLGYGQTGPDAQRAGYDVIVAGTAGLTHITGPKVGTMEKISSEMSCDFSCSIAI